MINYKIEIISKIFGLFYKYGKEPTFIQGRTKKEFMRLIVPTGKGSKVFIFNREE